MPARMIMFPVGGHGAGSHRSVEMVSFPVGRPSEERFFTNRHLNRLHAGQVSVTGKEVSSGTQLHVDQRDGRTHPESHVVRDGIVTNPQPPFQRRDR